MSISSVSSVLDLQTTKLFIEEYLSIIGCSIDSFLVSQCQKIIDFISTDSKRNEDDIVKRMVKVLLSLELGLNSIGSSKNYEFVVFSHSNIKVGIDTRKNGSYLIVKFTIINLNDFPIDDASLLIEHIPELQIYCKNDKTSIAASGKSEIEFALQIKAPFSSSIRCQIMSSMFTEVFTLPITICDFSSEIALPSDVFINKWNNITHSENKCEIRIKANREMQKKAKHFMCLAFGCVNFIQELRNHNYICAMKIETVSETCGFLCRVFGEFDEIVIQARCSSPQLAKAIQNVLNLVHFQNS